MIDDVAQTCDAAIVVKATLGVRPQTAERRGSIAMVGSATGFEIVNADFLGRMKIPSWLLIAVVRFEEEDGRISRIRVYNFSPEVIQEVDAELVLTAVRFPIRGAWLVKYAHKRSGGLSGTHNRSHQGDLYCFHPNRG